MSIASRQDTSTFQSKDKSAGAGVSVTFAGQVSASGNLSVGKQSGDFASVETQAGIRAGDGGFGIRVAGATDLKGAVIASTADAARNSLTTGTLTATDIANRETFKATSTSIGAGIGNIGQSRTGQTTTDGTGNKPAGLATPLGNLSATPPAALSASGSQSSTTVSAIASGGITVTSGDTASLGVAQTISRDTSGANEALTKQFTEAKRNEIAQGFEATRQLVSEVGTFFANRGRDEQDLRDKAKDPNAVGADGQPLTAQQRLDLIDKADNLRSTFGAGSIARIGATALTGAAGANVTGGLGSLVQGAAVNVLQSLAATEVKKLADSIQGDPTTRESVRAALQAVVGCAGASSGGSGGCGSAAIGAAASVVLNNLISAADPRPVDRDGDGVIDPLSVEEVEARRNLVGTLVAAIASGTSLDANAATTAAIIETENNAGLIINGRLVQPAGGRTVSDAEFPAAYRAYLNSLRTSPNLAERQLYQQIVGQFGGDVNRATEYRSLDQSVVNTLGQNEAIRLVNAGADARGVANFASQRGGITPADIALFGGDAGQLNVALQYGYTLDEIRASNGQIPAAFAGIDPDAANRAPGEYGFHKPGLSDQGRALVTTRLFLSDTSNFLSANLGEGTRFNTYVTRPAGAVGSFFYNGLFADGAPVDVLVNRPFYAITRIIGQTPLGDPGVITTLETSGIPFGRATGAGLQGLRSLNIARAGAIADGIVVNTNVAGRANFYVTSEGVAVPATGFRAITGQYGIDEALTGTIAPRDGGTYVTFNNISNLSPLEVRSLLQLPGTPSHIAIFDTLPHIRSLRIPRGFQGTGNLPEPLTVTYPNFGTGGGTQAVTSLPITPVVVKPLPAGGR